MSNGVLGALLVVATESMFFVGLVFAALQIRRAAPLWPPDGSPVLEPWLLVLNTAGLVASSITAHAAMRSAGAGDRRRAIRSTTATMLLGTLFLIGQVALYRQLGGWRPADGTYATLFEILVGFHGLHAAAGLGLWLLVLARSLATAAAGAARTGATVATPAVVAAVYWHFVTVVWLALLVVWALP